ncbi:MAG: alpha-glucosidase C-terminal domain-containing protein, partial [Anaerolineales bacterium]
LAQTPPIPENCQWCIFLRNHDELTLEMVTPEERQFLWETYAPEPRMRLNLGIRRRLAPLLDHDRRKIEMAHSLLLTLPGSPILYYGDEVGMGDDIWLPDRDGVRTPMQWDAGVGGGRNVADQRADPNSLWHTLRRMVAVRSGRRAFSWGKGEFLPAGSQAVLAVVRTEAQETVLAVHNFAPTEQRVALDLERWRGRRVQDLLAGRPFPDVGEGVYTFELGPYGYLWLKLV